MTDNFFRDVSRYRAPAMRVNGPTDLESAPRATPFTGVYRSDLPTDLYFYANLRSGNILYVTLHGATRRGVDTYPRFDRTGSFAKAKVPFLAFSDPCLGLDPDLELAWYLGGSDWDPQSSIIEIIESARLVVGADSVCIIGGSGGGFAALRLSHAVRSSLAFVFNPQVRLDHYIPRVRDYYLKSMHGDLAEDVMARRPGTYDMSELYRTLSGVNKVYFLQSITDSTHLINHYKPFKDAVGIPSIHGVDPSGSVQLRLIDSERVGHRPPSAEEFEKFLAKAIEWAF